MATHFCSKHSLIILAFLALRTLHAIGPDACEKFEYSFYLSLYDIDAELDELALIQCNVENSLSTVDRAPSKRSYPSFSSSAENFDFSLTNLGIERFSIAALFPRKIEESIDSWQKRMKKTYFSIRRNFNQSNPFPSLEYFFTSRNPAFPFIYIYNIDELARNLRTIPLIDDHRIALESNSDRSYGVGFILRFN